MKPRNRLLRCFARTHDGIWEAYCLDLTLAAQGETFEEARQALHEQIADYVYEAIEGEDKAYAKQLLNRKAPLSFWIYYYFQKVRLTLSKWFNSTQGLARIFKENFPNGAFNAR